jgi:hypothetical protein
VALQQLKALLKKVGIADEGRRRCLFYGSWGALPDRVGGNSECALQPAWMSFGTSRRSEFGSGVRGAFTLRPLRATVFRHYSSRTVSKFSVRMSLYILQLAMYESQAESYHSYEGVQRSSASSLQCPVINPQNGTCCHTPRGSIA